MRRFVIVLLVGLFIFVGSSCSDEVSQVSIQGFYDEPASMSNAKTIILDGLYTGEFLEIIVSGEILDFEHVSILIDEGVNEFITKEILHEFDQLNDVTIVIRTYMPEGIPTEAIRWKSASGEEYEFYVGEFDLSEDGERLIEFILE